MLRFLLLVSVCSVGCAPELRTTPTNSNSPMQPLRAASNQVQTCWNDVECEGADSHCAKDRPDDIGVCTRTCKSVKECASNAAWSCEIGVWNTATKETRSMCMLTCLSDEACPRGMSCNDNFCGTPCTGANCDCGPGTRECDDEGNVVVINDCGVQSAQTCTSEQACVSGFCK